MLGAFEIVQLITIVMLVVVGGVVLWLHWQLDTLRTAGEQLPLVSSKLTRALQNAQQELKSLKKDLNFAEPELLTLLKNVATAKDDLTLLMERAERVLEQLERARAAAPSSALSTTAPSGITLEHVLHAAPTSAPVLKPVAASGPTLESGQATGALGAQVIVPKQIKPAGMALTHVAATPADIIEQRLRAAEQARNLKPTLARPVLAEQLASPQPTTAPVLGNPTHPITETNSGPIATPRASVKPAPVQRVNQPQRPVSALEKALREHLGG